MEKKRKILIVEDDEEMQALLARRLAFHGFECVSALTVESALKKIKEIKPDLVLLDLGFQKTDGTAFLENFEQWLGAKKKNRLPIIVVSGHKEREIVEYVLDAGAVGFVAKPFETEELLKLVREHLHT